MPARPNYVWLAIMLILAQAALVPLRVRGGGTTPRFETARVPLAVGDWRGRQADPFDQTTLDLLQPDAYLNRVYERFDGASLMLTVVYGHHKSTFHSPGFCLLGGGWSIIAKSVVAAPASPGGRSLQVNRFLLQRRDERTVVLYCYLYRGGAATSWARFQGRLLADRLRGGPGAGALVRLVIPAEGEGAAATALGLGFLGQVRGALSRSMDTGAARKTRSEQHGNGIASRGGGHQSGHRH
jgi:EpsI family protein